MQRDKWALMPGLLAALTATLLLLRWPPTQARDLLWAALMATVAISLAAFESLRTRSGGRWRVRWVALALALVALWTLIP